MGGGRDAFIGAVHRIAMRLDGKIDLVAGAFSESGKVETLRRRSTDRSKSGLSGLPGPMVEREQKLPVGERIDFVSIVTPNRTHVPVAKAFLEGSFNVVCDKPLTFDLGGSPRPCSESLKRLGKSSL